MRHELVIVQYGLLLDRLAMSFECFSTNGESIARGDESLLNVTSNERSELNHLIDSIVPALIMDRYQLNASVKNDTSTTKPLQFEMK